MKIEGPLMSHFAAGTIGKTLTFRRTPTGQVAYAHFIPKQPNTKTQADRHALYSILAARWHTLSSTERDHFAPAAAAYRITLFNAYMGYNLRRLNPAQLDGLLAWWPAIVPAGNVLHDLLPGRWDAEFVSIDPTNAWPQDSQRAGQVIEFPGTGYANVPSPPSSTAAYTWAFWFKQNSYTGTAAIVDTGDTAHYLQGRTAGQRLQHVLRGVAAYTNQFLLDDFTWHHYAGTYQGTNIEIYLDARYYMIAPQPIPPTANVYMRFGAHSIGVPPVYFNGRVDDLRFYSRSLDLPDIQELAAR